MAGSGLPYRLVGCSALVEISRPRQNRVTPYGDIVAASARGLFMGNRGDLHAPDGTYSGQQYANRAWLCCTLKHRAGRRISFDVPGRYYPLFFFDEAVALAAGHRPCGQCRSDRLMEFKRAWEIALSMTETISTRAIDAELHRYRRARRARCEDASLLPNGTFVEVPIGGPALVYDGKLHPWCWEGYGPPYSLSGSERVRVVTPDPMVLVLSSGYVPTLHSSLSSEPAMVGSPLGAGVVQQVARD